MPGKRDRMGPLLGKRLKLNLADGEFLGRIGGGGCIDNEEGK